VQIAYLSADNILRRLPSIINPEQRLTVDVQVYCHDIMANSISRLWQLCASFDPKRPCPIEVADIFGEAWRIIDQVDLLRQIYKHAPEPVGPKTTEFLQYAEGARDMRNTLDHIVQRVPNIARRTGASESLFGSISYVRCPSMILERAVPGQIIECELVKIVRGTIPGYKGEAESSFSTDKITSTISNLNIFAAGKLVPLDRLFDLHSEILIAFSEDIYRQISDELPILSAETGYSEMELGSPTPTMLSAGLKLSVPFGPLDAQPLSGDNRNDV
jgi:hypothetical protein